MSITQKTLTTLLALCCFHNVIGKTQKDSTALQDYVKVTGWAAPESKFIQTDYINPAKATGFTQSQYNQNEIARSMDIKGNTLVFTTQQYSDSEWSVFLHVYRKQSGKWQFTESITTPLTNSLYTSVLTIIDDNTIALGVSNTEINNKTVGAVYIFSRQKNQWQNQRLLPSQLEDYQRFGQTVNSQGNQLLIGEKNAIIVFDRRGANNWSNTGKIAFNEYLGTIDFGSVELSGHYLALPITEWTNGSVKHSILIYQRNQNNGQWQMLNKLPVKSETLGRIVLADNRLLALTAKTGVVFTTEDNWKTVTESKLSGSYNDAIIKGDTIIANNNQEIAAFSLLKNSLWKTWVKTHQLNISHLIEPVNDSIISLYPTDENILINVNQGWVQPRFNYNPWEES